MALHAWPHLDYAVVLALRQGGQVWPVDQEALPPAVRAASLHGIDAN